MARTCLRSRGMGFLITTEILSAFGRTPAGEVERLKKAASVEPRRAFEGDNLRLRLRGALEERTHRLDVGRRVGVEDDYIVEVGGHLFQALYNLVDSLDEPPG